MNQPPQVGNDMVYGQMTPGTPTTVSVLANDYDPEGGALTVTAVTQPSAGTAAVGPNGANVVFTPAGEREYPLGQRIEQARLERGQIGHRLRVELGEERVASDRVRHGVIDDELGFVHAGELIRLANCFVSRLAEIGRAKDLLDRVHNKPT